MKKLLLLLVLVGCSAVAMQQPVPQAPQGLTPDERSALQMGMYQSIYQKFVGKVTLRIKNRTNNNYLITTSQVIDSENKLVNANEQIEGVTGDFNPHPLDSGLSANSEKDFLIELDDMDPNNKNGTRFVKDISVIDSSGIPRARIHLGQHIFEGRTLPPWDNRLLRRESTYNEFDAMFALIRTNNSQNNIRIKDEVLVDLAKGKANFQVIIVLYPQALPTLDITAVQ